MNIFRKVTKSEAVLARQKVAYICDEVYLRTGLKVRDLEVRGVVQVLADMPLGDVFSIYRQVAHPKTAVKD